MNSHEISKEWLRVFRTLGEPEKRWVAAIKSLELGYGGITAVSRETGLSRPTITQGRKDVSSKKSLKVLSDRCRREGGGRKKLASMDSRLIKAVENIVDETSAGDPMSELKWTCKSTRSIAEMLVEQGFKISHSTVMTLLRELGYSLRANKKMLSGRNHPDRDSQFRYINSLVRKFTKDGNPVISVDTKKKELVGNFKNDGQTWCKEDQKVLDHDFRSLGQGIAIPYGAYDVNRNEGFVNIGMSSDTSEFAVNSIWQWWRHFGRKHYQNANRLLVCADGGGSNGSRTRAWKFFLQELSNKIGMEITVSHYPPGTSKWNKIEHRMFSFISMNWKGRPLENYEAVVNLISSTKTRSGLTVKAKLDRKKYKKGHKVSEEDFEGMNLKLSKKFPQWNYSIQPFD